MPESFDALVAEYERRIYNVVLRILGDPDEAADVTQEVFISAYKSFDRFRGESHPYTWLYQIAINHCRNRLRKRVRDRRVRVESLDTAGGSLEDGAQTRDIPDATHAPHAVLEEKELRQRILDAIEGLPPEYREVVVLREMQNLSYNDIAEATGLSLDNVKTRLSRARLMLRRRLEHYYQG